MNNDNQNPWEKLLDHRIVKNNLQISSFYILLFEYFKTSITSKPRIFFQVDIIEDEDSKNIFEEQIIKPGKSIIYSSIEWLKSNNFCSENLIEKYTKFKNYRNKLTHELPEFIIGRSEIDTEILFDLASSIVEEDRIWIHRFESHVNPYFPDIANDDLSEIEPGSKIFISILIDNIFGNSELSDKLLALLKHQKS